MVSAIKEEHNIPESCVSKIIRDSIVRKVASLKDRNNKSSNSPNTKYAHLLREFDEGKAPASLESVIIKNLEPEQPI